jgi:hypothetical protein
MTCLMEFKSSVICSSKSSRSGVRTPVYLPAVDIMDFCLAELWIASRLHLVDELEKDSILSLLHIPFHKRAIERVLTTILHEGEISFFQKEIFRND